MSDSTRQRQTTIIGVVILVAIAVTLLIVLPIAIGKMRETARCADCLNKSKQMSLALQNYHDSQGGFPTAASPRIAGARDIGGYSFIFELLPAITTGCLYDQIKALETRTTHDPLTNSVARSTRLGALACPSYAGPNFLDDKNKQFAITNYKAMSATHKESLACANDPNAVPKYGQPAQHPDGGLIPLRKLKVREFTDGLANTIIITETMDETGSYWAAGNTASLVAQPSSVKYVQVAGAKPFCAPSGFVAGKYDDQARYDNPETYFSWDFDAKQPATGAGPYDAAKKMTAGPSSRHPAVINCALADGNARGIAKNIDQALLMFLVTRAGDDPAGEFVGREE